MSKFHNEDVVRFINRLTGTHGLGPVTHVGEYGVQVFSWDDGRYHYLYTNEPLACQIELVDHNPEFPRGSVVRFIHGGSGVAGVGTVVGSDEHGVVFVHFLADGATYDVSTNDIDGDWIELMPEPEGP